MDASPCPNSGPSLPPGTPANLTTQPHLPLPPPPPPPPPPPLPQQQQQQQQQQQVSTSPVSQIPAMLLLGGTGTGKSSFIASLQGSPSSPMVGHSLSSCTTGPALYPTSLATPAGPHLDIVLIDTPGLDDTTQGNMETLASIVAFISDPAFTAKYTIVSVLFFFSILQVRLTRSSALMLQILQAICGPDFAPHVLIVTTMWNTLGNDETRLLDAERRYSKLQEHKTLRVGLLDSGARMASWDGTATGAGKKVWMAYRRDTVAPKLYILFEMEGGMKLEDTEAGKLVTEERRKEEEVERIKLREAQEEVEEMRATKQRLEREAALREVQPSRDQGYHQARGERAGEGAWAASPSSQAQRRAMPVDAGRVPHPGQQYYHDEEDNAGNVGGAWVEQGYQDGREDGRRRRSHHSRGHRRHDKHDEGVCCML